jgi:lysine-specific histone demethylase 1
MAAKIEPQTSPKAKFVPTTVNHESLFAGDLEGAAFQSGVPFEEMTDMEQRAFPDVRTGSKPLKKIFFFVRNRLLQLWLQNPKQELLFESALAKLDPPYNSDAAFACRIHAFLTRYGLVRNSRVLEWIDLQKEGID